tara:strand:+ start:10713 stop:11618 length:906 start_codon:yes stop_codon:yes gene_type:complete
MTFSFVIPTKDRPRELNKMFNSIMKQSRMPNQIIIIDQSKPHNTLKKKVKSIIKAQKIKLNYVHNQNISGLIEAKSISIKYNECDYISFFDDDIVLEPDYLKSIENAFLIDPNMLGVNGLIMNLPKKNHLNRFFFQITHFGLFEDNRIMTLRSFKTGDYNPKSVNVLSGGLSTWKKEVFDKVPFDFNNGIHSYEDVEFSIRVKKNFPQAMFVVPNAKLYHFHSAGNRKSLLKKVEGDVFEVITIFKKNKKDSLLYIDLLALLLGLFFNSFFLSLIKLDLTFIYLYFKGLRKGITRKIVKNG